MLIVFSSLFPWYVENLKHWSQGIIIVDIERNPLDFIIPTYKQYRIFRLYFKHFFSLVFDTHFPIICVLQTPNKIHSNKKNSIKAQVQYRD